MIAAAVVGAEDSGDGDFAGVPEDCLSWTEDGSGNVTCTEHSDLMGDPMAGGFGDSGIPGFFGVAFFLVLILGVGGTIWRVSTARRMARDSGMNVGDATAMTLLDDDGLAATYLASNLRHDQPSAPAAEGSRPTAAQRLTELQQLLAQGLITQAEHDERRRAILDEL